MRVIEAAARKGAAKSVAEVAEAVRSYVKESSVLPRANFRKWVLAEAVGARRTMRMLLLSQSKIASRSTCCTAMARRRLALSVWHNSPSPYCHAAVDPWLTYPQRMLQTA